MRNVKFKSHPDRKRLAGAGVVKVQIRKISTFVLSGQKAKYPDSWSSIIHLLYYLPAPLFPIRQIIIQQYRLVEAVSGQAGRAAGILGEVQHGLDDFRIEVADGQLGLKRGDGNRVGAGEHKAPIAERGDVGVVGEDMRKTAFL